MKSSYIEEYSRTQGDPAASDWLKNILRTGEQRDVLDVTCDLEVALELFQTKLKEVLK